MFLKETFIRLRREILKEKKTNKINKKKLDFPFFMKLLK